MSDASPTAADGASTGATGDQAKAAGRAKAGGARAGYTYLHSAVDGFSRLGRASLSQATNFDVPSAHVTHGVAWSGQGWAPKSGGTL